MTIRREILPTLCVLCLLACLATIARAGDGNWPMWRGPLGDGRADDVNVPTKWSDTENVTWKIDLPGWSHSSPIVWNDRIFLTSFDPDTQARLLLCINRADGKTLWKKVLLMAPPEKKHKLNSYASGTPATDGKHVFVAMFEAPKIQIFCYDFDGNVVWKQSPGEFHSVHGFCTSPVIYKDTVILNCDQDATAYIVAYDRASGKEIWRTDRPNKTRSYCTPLIATLAGKTQMVLSGSKCVASYDPDTGKQNWLIDGPTEQFVASLVQTDGMLFVTGGFPQLHLLGVDPAGAGNITKTNIVWRDTKGVSYVPSPIAHDKWFFIVSDGGVCSCIEAKTGKVLWHERLGRHHSASAVSANGLLYFTSDDGEVFVLKAGPEFQIVSQNKMNEECYASPAISRGQIFLRTQHHLWCIGKDTGSVAAP